MRTSFKTLAAFLFVLLLGVASAQAADQQDTKSFMYKKAKQADLELVVHYPPGWKETNMRPAIVFFFGGGWTDRLAAMGHEFMKKSKELAHRAELFTAEGQPHGFFNRPPWQEKTTQRMDEFLVSIGYLTAKPTKSGD